MHSPARTARSGSSSWAATAPNSAITPSPVNLATTPPVLSTDARNSPKYGARKPSTSSTSSRSERLVNPARSANSTETTRRSRRSEGGAATNGVPHSGQNFAPSLTVEQFGQVAKASIIRGIAAFGWNVLRAIAVTLDADAAARVANHVDALGEYHELTDLRLIEAQAAAAYWVAWRGVRVAFATRDTDRVPDHWTRFSQRVSPLTGSPRVAADPINAMLNLCYALLEAESRIALLAVGLDPGIGILHTDQRARDSFALDPMEAVRPAVDRYILDLVVTQSLRAADFAETSSGQCRIMPGLARQLAATSPAWAGEVAPHAEAVARRLANDAGIAAPPTTLTGEARRLARPAGSRTKPHTALRPVAPARTCHDCGTTVRIDRKRCPACHAAANAERLRAQQADEVARRQNTGQHPSQQPAVRERIGQTRTFPLGGHARGFSCGWIHRTPVRVSPPHPSTPRRHRTPHPRRGDRTVTRLLRSDPRRQTRTPYPALGRSPSRQPQPSREVSPRLA